MAVLQELLPCTGAVHLDLGNHVARDVASPPCTFSPVEAICILVAVDLRKETPGRQEGFLPSTFGQIGSAGLGNNNKVLQR